MMLSQTKLIVYIIVFQKRFKIDI